jgi:PIN domain nuclease of toxin-antitoxin system
VTAVPTPPPRVVLVLDTSLTIAWVRKEAGRWERVEKLLRSPRLDCVVPAPALAETIYMAQDRGVSVSASTIHTALVAQRLRIEPLTEDDAVWAGHRIRESHVNPAQWTNSQGQDRDGSLSLGDGLILAVAHRLRAQPATFDAAWGHFPTMDFNVFNVWQVPVL